MTVESLDDTIAVFTQTTAMEPDDEDATGTFTISSSCRMDVYGL